MRRHSDRGATMIETLITLPLLLVLLVVSFDLLRISFNILTIRFVTAEAMREASLGGQSAGELQASIISGAARFGINLAAGDISMCSLDDYPCSKGTLSPSGHLQVSVLEIDLPLRGYCLSAAQHVGLFRSDIATRTTAIGLIEPD